MALLTKFVIFPSLVERFNLMSRNTLHPIAFSRTIRRVSEETPNVGDKTDACRITIATNFSVTARLVVVWLDTTFLQLFWSNLQEILLPRTKDNVGDPGQFQAGPP